MQAGAAAAIEELAGQLAQTHKLVVCTGAGVSAESGVPTFRDASSGLWAKYDPMTLATPEAFARDPLLVWNWYLHRRRQVDALAPNPGHTAIAELQGILNEVVVVTQNVDGLHRRAGSRTVLELHGTLYGTKRFHDGHKVDYRWPGDLTDFEFTQDSLPRCPDTGELLRPDIVWFGEALDSVTLSQAFMHARSADCVIVAGTSGVVYPAAAVPEEALQLGVYTAEINPDETELARRADAYIALPSGVALPQIVARVKQLRGRR